MTAAKRGRPMRSGVFQVRKRKDKTARQWTVYWPVDPCSDYQQSEWFRTYEEAIRFAQREAVRADLLEKFEEFLCTNQNPARSHAPEFDHTGLDTMYKIFRWWGSYDLAGLLENV